MFKRTCEATLAACALLIVLVITGPTTAQVQKTALCHATGSGHFNFLNLPPEPLDNHIDGNGSFLAGHEEDFFPVDNDCDKSNDPGGGGDPDPGAIPEPVTILLFGAGVAGVGYASRRFRRRSSKAGGE